MTPTELIWLGSPIGWRGGSSAGGDREAEPALAAQRLENQALKDEIARLKHLPPRPPHKALRNGAGDGSSGGRAERDEDGASKRRRGPGVSKLSVDRTETLSVEAPTGSRHKGFEDIIVQDLMLKAETTRYRRERWETPDGEQLIAPLPAGIVGRLGPASDSSGADASFSGPDDLREDGGASDRPGLGDFQAPGGAAFDRQAGGFPCRGRGGAAGGIAGARFVTVDDTGARHAGKSCFTTHIGSDRFTAFRTGPGNRA